MREARLSTVGDLRTLLAGDGRAAATAGQSGCLDNIDGGVAKNDSADRTVPKDDFQVFGPYEVAIGGTFKAVITGSGDVDLYVKKHEKVSASSYETTA